METQIFERAQMWLSDKFDADTRREVAEMMEHDSDRLRDAFYKDLEFGTGGLRGIMGAGTNRMNKYTVGMATQGLSNYLLRQFPDVQVKCAIAYDSRNNSKYFADIAASVFSGNGIHVFLFDRLRPTPELSFAIRHLGCHSGVVITASHNPKEYNGYKVYWSDGGQIIPPHDKGIIEDVRKITNVEAVKFDDAHQNVEIIGEAVDKAYLDRIAALSLQPDIVRSSDLKIVFTPIHGSTVDLLPRSLRRVGFKDVHIVAAQSVPDGNFPTVASPNPENPEALSMALQEAKELHADLVMGTDPDGDRLGLIARKHNGEYVLLNGNQTAAILTYYLLEQWHRQGRLSGNEYIVKTIVTTDLLTAIADSYHVKHYDVLTGFKYIADIIERKYGTEQFVGGGEESFGYLAGDFVRDKDAVMSCTLAAEVAAWAKQQGKTLFDILLEIYRKFGFYLEGLKSLTRQGISGQEEIRSMMDSFRNEPPESIDGKQVVMVHDFEKGRSVDKISDLRYDILLPRSNVLQFVLVDGTRITVRPSGTEPKIKFYVSVHDQLSDIDMYQQQYQRLSDRIDAIFSNLIK